MKPKHIGIIPDGCRRWALREGFSLSEGYAQSADLLYELSIDWCIIDNRIPFVTIFGVSTENYQKRPKIIVEYYYNGLERMILKLLSDERIYEHGIRVCALGDRRSLPFKLLNLISKAETETCKHKNYLLTLCLIYGGRWEIIESVRSILHDFNRNLNSDKITEKDFEYYLPSTGLPDLDLVIRTAENRISNFMLWKIAYAEIYFCNKYFPDFNRDDLLQILADFSQTKRRYGGLSPETSGF